MTEYCSNFNKKNGIVTICDNKSLLMKNCYRDPSLSVKGTKQQGNSTLKEGGKVLDQCEVVDDNLFGGKKKLRTCLKISHYKEEECSNNDNEEYSNNKDEAYSDNEGEVGEDSNYTDKDEKTEEVDKANSNERVKKPKKVKQKVVEYKTAGLSSYEKMIEEKRKERMAFLQSISIDEAKAGLCAAVNSTKRKVTRRIKETNDNPQPVRRSIRPRNTVDLSEKALLINHLFLKTTEKLKNSPQNKWSKRIKNKISHIKKKEANSNDKMTEYYSNFNLKKVTVTLYDIKSQHMKNCFRDPSLSVNGTKQQGNSTLKEGGKVLDQCEVVDDNLFGMKKKLRTCLKISHYKEEKCSNNEDEEYSDNKDEAYSDNVGEGGEDSNYTDEGEKVARHENKANSNEKVKKPKRVKQKIVEYKTAGLSSYEKMIVEKRNERMAFLQSINIDEAKAGLCAAVNSTKRTVTRRIKETNDNPQPVRRSIRPKNTVDFSEKALRLNQLFVKNTDKLNSSQNNWSKRIKNKRISEESLSVEAMERIEEKAFEISFKEALEPKQSYEDYIKDVNLQESKSEPKFHSYDISTLKNLSLNGSVTEIPCVPIYALTWYPSIESFIVVAGDKIGNLIIWNAGSDSDSYMFNVHFKKISHLQFNPFNPVQLISSSNDGTLCCGDMVKQKFNEICNISYVCTYFDFLSSEGYLVALGNGHIVIVDKRTDKSVSAMRHDCHYPHGVKTVNVHPVNKNLFVTAGSYPYAVRLWDLRNLMAKPVDEIGVNKVHSAFFSPVTGNSILSTAENSISVFDSLNLSEHKKKLQFGLGSYSGMCRATWLPHSEEAFVRNINKPNRTEVYDKDINVIYTRTYHLTSSIYAFHPFIPAYADGGVRYYNSAALSVLI